MNNIVWRPYEKRDADRVRALHSQMEQKIGRSLDLPDLMERPVISAAVGETNGIVTHCLFAEAEAELCAASPAVLSPKDMQGAIDILLPNLLYYKIRIARSFVPSEMMQQGKRGRKSAIARIMDRLGFTKENQTVAQFFKWL